MQAAQDPQELFDVVTEAGEPTGITKARGDVHHDGDWHRAVHVWVYGVDQFGPFLLLNLRGENKDTWPLALDATVGGHLGAGETVEDAFREIYEEIGVNIDPSRIEWLFQRKRSSGDLIPGIQDNELQEVFAVRDDRPLTAYAPNPAELEGLVRIDLDHAILLFHGAITQVSGSVLRAHSGHIEEYVLTTDRLLVRGTDTYFIDVIDAITARVS